MSEDENNIRQEAVKGAKKPFNKKKWRQQKYSGKARVQKWDNIRRKQVQRQYIKEQKKLESNVCLRNPEGINKNSKASENFKQAQLQYQALQQENEEKRLEQERIRKEKIKAIKAYKEKKVARFKKLSQKTRKGQPLMRGRIELLLEEIKKKFGNSDNTVNS